MSRPAPSPAHSLAADSQVLRLKRGEERRLAAGHLWVFSNEVDTERTPLGQFVPGALVELRSYRDSFLAKVEQARREELKDRQAAAKEAAAKVEKEAKTVEAEIENEGGDEALFL